MASSRATILAAVISSCCTDVTVIAWPQETADFDSPGLSLLQLRFASTSAGANGAEAATEGSHDEHAQATAERALPWPTARSQVVTQRALPWATMPRATMPREYPTERVLPWLAAPQKQEALLDTTKAENDEDFMRDTADAAGMSPLASGCHFTDPVVGVSPGSYNNIMHNVKTLEECQSVCDAEEESCSAVVFKLARSLCVTLPREYDSNLKMRNRGPVVSNRVCPDSSSVASDEMASVEMASDEAPACPFSTAIRGHSPGPMLQEHEGVTTLADCQKLCASNAACLSVVHREGQHMCFLLPRTYNENYEVTSDDAIASNKVCGH